jgi:TonB family protein
MTEAGMSETWTQWEGHILNGEFPLQRYLGGSDHSAVFLTERTGEPQRAVKFISVDPADRDSQLLRWKAAVALTHPNLIRIFETGQCKLGDAELLYVVMEYAEEDLSQILPQRSLTPAEAQESLRPVLKVLAHIHGLGFVHGSVRPSNIMAIGDQVKLSSDTLRAPGDAGRRAEETSVYAAPETARGEFSPAGDAWSLGVTVIEVLTRRRPDWNPAQPGSPALPEGLPEPFLEIVRRCLQVDPKQRWTAAELTARLEEKQHAAAEPPTQAVARPQVKDDEKPVKWLYLLALAAAVLLVIVVIVVSRSKKSEPAEHPVPPAQAQQPESHPPASAAPQPGDVRREPKPRPGKPGRTPSASKVEAQSPTEAVPLPAASPGSSLPPGVVHQVLPEVSASARDTIAGKVRVRVKVEVDTSGNVVSASFDSPGPSKYFARLAIEAAQRWRFSPAQVDGRAVASQWLLRFGFTRTDTEVVATRTAP